MIWVEMEHVLLKSLILKFIDCSIVFMIIYGGKNMRKNTPIIMNIVFFYKNNFLYGQLNT